MHNPSVIILCRAPSSGPLAKIPGKRTIPSWSVLHTNLRPSGANEVSVARGNRAAQFKAELHCG